MYHNSHFRKCNGILKTLQQIYHSRHRYNLVQCRSCRRSFRTLFFAKSLPIDESKQQIAFRSTSTKFHYHQGISEITKAPNVLTGRQTEQQVCDRLRKDVLLREAYRKNVVLSRKSWLPQSTMATQLLIQLSSVPSNVEKLALLTSIDGDAFADLTLSMISNGRLPLRERMPLLRLLEEAACVRLSKTDFPTMLLLADMFYVASYDARRYHNALFRTTHLQWQRLSPTPANIVQLLFFIAVERDAPVELMRCIETYLYSVADTLTARDLSLVCHAFFASNTAMRKHDLLHTIASVVGRELDTTPAYLLVNILKVFRHAGYASLSFYEHLGANVSLHGETIGVVSHFVDAYAGLRITHDRLFAAVAYQFASLQSNKSINKSAAQTVRIKDLGRMMWAYTSLRHELPAELINVTIELLRQNPSHWHRYPEAFVECLIVMVMNGVYPPDLLNYALSTKFIQFKTDRPLEQHYQLLLLDNALGIENPQYTGNRISKTTKDEILLKDRGDINHELTYRQGLAAMYVTLVNLFNGDPDAVYCHFILNSSKLADLEIHLDSEGRQKTCTSEQEDLFYSLQKKLDVDSCEATGCSVIAGLLSEINGEESAISRPQTENIYPPARHKGNSGDRKISIKVMGWNQYPLNKPVLLGHPQMELRLLQSLGYEVLVINPRDAAKLDGMSKEQRLQYVKENVLKRLGVAQTSLS